MALEPTTSVPQVPRQRPSPAPWVIPQRFVHRFPAPDDEQGEIDRSEFAIQFFSIILAIITATTLVATFVLVPSWARCCTIERLGRRDWRGLGP